MSKDDNSKTDGRETRDVRDLSTNEHVEEEVDDMLGIPENDRPRRNLSVPSDAEVEADPDRERERTQDVTRAGREPANEPAQPQAQPQPPGQADGDGDGDNTDSEIRPEVREHIEKAKQRENEQAEAGQKAEESGTGGTEVTVSSLEEPDEWEEFDFEAQDWTLDDAKEPEVRDIRGMKFKFEEPANDDGVLNQLENASDGDQWEQMYALVQLVVTAPRVTPDRWGNMSFPSRLSLGSAAADYLGLDEGFLDE